MASLLPSIGKSDPTFRDQSPVGLNFGPSISRITTVMLSIRKPSILTSSSEVSIGSPCASHRSIAARPCRSCAGLREEAPRNLPFRIDQRLIHHRSTLVSHGWARISTEASQTLQALGGKTNGLRLHDREIECRRPAAGRLLWAHRRWTTNGQWNCQQCNGAI
jgi:hypothetical protein